MLNNQPMNKIFQTERALWLAFKDGQRRALDQLFRTYYPHLFRYGLKVCLDSDVTDSTLQDFFLYLFEHRQGLSLPQNTKAYLFRAYRRKLLQHLRDTRSKRMKQQELGIYQIDIQFSTEDMVIRDEEQQHIQHTLLRMLNDLPRRQREAIYLRYYDDLDIREVAEILSITYQGTVNTIHKAIKALRANDGLEKIVASWS